MEDRVLKGVEMLHTTPSKINKGNTTRGKSIQFGGAAEDRLTVLSDIDILIIVNRELTDQEKTKLKAGILWNAVDKYGLPWGYP